MAKAEGQVQFTFLASWIIIEAKPPATLVLYLIYYPMLQVPCREIWFVNNDMHGWRNLSLGTTLPAVESNKTKWSIARAVVNIETQ